jgi:AsmA family protein
MNGALANRKGLIWTVTVLAGLVAAAAILVALANAGHFRGALIRFAAARMGRQIQVRGEFEAHLFSLHPRVVATNVTIGNPPWTPPGITAEIGKLSLLMDMPRLGHSFGIERMEMEDATFHLERDSTNHANWQWTDPAKSSGAKFTIVRSLSVPHAHVLLDDKLRHLKFDGTVSVDEAIGPKVPRGLRLDGVGLLNGKTASIEITADPLSTASHDKPYHFNFVGGSSGSRLSGRGFLPEPFNFDMLDTSFDATGADLKDLYFLTGVTLVNTGTYALSGKASRRGTRTKFSDLVVTSGQSDMRGTVSIESSSGRPKIEADLNSQLLRVSDLGPRAAGRASESDTNPSLLLSNATLSVGAVRRGDAVVNFRARGVDVGRIPLHEVSAKLMIDHGILTVSPLAAEVYGGKLLGHLRLDARRNVPPADVDLKITDLQLEQVDRKDPASPPFEGLLQARVAVSGRGSSVHQIAASANGTVTAALPKGAIRASLAELTGIDLRGVGLLLTKNTEETVVRCGAASFQAHEGTLTVKSLVVDTERVLIVGEGQIHLDSEDLDLSFRGQPKQLRLFRLSLPISMRGTLAHPEFAIQARDASQNTEGQRPTMSAVTNRGLAKDADCAALLAQAAPPN